MGAVRLKRLLVLAMAALAVVGVVFLLPPVQTALVRAAIGGVDGTDLDIEDLGVVEDFMSDDPVTARPEESVGVVAHRMAEERVHRVVVIDDRDQPIGIVTTLDLLKVFPNG